MKTIRVISFFIIIPFSIAAQSIPTISLDTIVKTSEFYNGIYDIEFHGYGGSYWLLKEDFKLYQGYTNDHPPSNKKELVGSWIMSSDGLILTIDKPKRQGSSETFDDRRYKIYQFQWKTATDMIERHSRDSVSLISIGIILADNLEFNGVEELNNLNQYVKEQFKRSQLKPDEEVLRAFEDAAQIEDLVRKYFYNKKIIIGVKKYRNRNLWDH